jgi:translation initiation factor eIF-2B subunit epsilon
MFSSAQIKSQVMIGQNTCIEEDTFIQDTVIGDNVRIGKNCSITGSYIWDNCFIGDNCEITKSILAEDVTLRRDVVVNRGVVLGPRVVIGNGINIPEFSKLASTPQPVGNDVAEFETSDSEHTMDASEPSQNGDNTRQNGKLINA